MDAVGAAVRRDRAVVWGGTLALAAGAWAYLFYLRRGMGGVEGMAEMPGMAPVLAPWTGADLAFAAAMWAVMMVAMMLPATLPVILLFAALNRTRRERGGVGVPTAVFVLGYLAVWGGFSVVAALAQGGLHAATLLSPALTATSPLVAGGLLVAAGVYQLTPLKGACLARCRSPLGFFLTSWRDGARGAFRMGAGHGVYCLGCCWVLMGLLFVVGVMNLAWVAAISAFVLLEKVAPGGVLIGRVASVGLIVAGLVVASAAVRMT
jgi:predicted metal-binding membrane protein